VATVALLAPLGARLTDADAATSATDSRAVPGELIVRFATHADAQDRAAARSDAEVRLQDTLPVLGLQLVKTSAGQSAQEATAELNRSPDVLYAEPNLYRRASVVPNDAYYGYLWGDAAIHAPAAWDVTTGSPAVTAAVIDTGVDATHPDLQSQIWTNPGETGAGREANGIDDDGDGFVDDWRGWDFVEHDNLPSDANGHGTHVSGTIAATGNNGTGVTGLSWNSRVMPLRVLDAQGSGTVADLISAYRYASNKGTRVLNLSLGGSSFSNAERDAIAAAPNTLFVVAAGNGGSDQVGDDVDTTPQYPCAYPLANVVCVAAGDQDDARASFSNYGAQSVDLAAPGEHILSTVPGGYAFYDGTSMATPQVTGAAVLIWSLRPSESVAGVKADLLGGVDHLSAFAGSTVSGGRLNVERSLGESSTPPPADSTPAAPAPAPKAPATVPAAARPKDRTAPRVYLRAAARQRLRSLLSHGLALRARCSERCSVALELTIGGVKASKTHQGRRTVARARFALSATRRRMTIRMSAAGRRLLRTRRPRQVTLKVFVRDTAGNARRSSVRVALRR
jgi:subtilisin family serine protease